MNIRYHVMARREIVETTEYYGRQQVELGDEFLSEVNVAIERIAANPLQFEQVRPGIRRYLLDRFPYGVYYRVLDADLVQIMVVKHHHRRPAFGMRRK